MNIKILLTGPAIALGAALAMATPAAAGDVCELNGGSGVGGATSTGPSSLACGPFATTGSAAGATALGNGAIATGEYSTSLGEAAGYTVSGDDYTILVGAWATSSSVGIPLTNILASTYSPTTGGFGSVDIGAGTLQGGTDNVQVGNFSNMGSNTALVTASTSLGTATTTSASNAVAIGAYTTVSGAGGVAVGDSADATAAGAIAIGQNAQGTGINSVAIGNGASNATFANSVALGNGTVNTAANQVSVGGRTIGNVANGVALTDAVNLGQLNAATAGVNAALIGLQGDVDVLYNQNRKQDRNINKANEGVAMALAMESPNVPAGSRFAVSGGIGGYQGRNALATAISAAIGEKATVSAGLGYGLNSGEIGYRAGFQVAF